MGQTQLLLITLGVIIAGTAVIIGMNLFQANAIEANRNGITNDLLSIANMSQAHFKKTAQLGGGNRNFQGFTIPKNMQSNEYGDYTIVYLRQDQALFQGVGKEPVGAGVGCDQSQQYVTHRILVYPDSVRVQIVY